MSSRFATSHRPVQPEREVALDAAPPARRPGLVPLGRWFGIPVAAHWTTLGVFALFTQILATTILPSAVGASTWQYWVGGLVTSAVFLASLVGHELAHALTARHHGVRVTGITLWLLGGVTELDDDAPTPRADGLIAAAGPLASLGVGAVSILLAATIGTAGILGTALAWLGAISVMLAVFNLLPGAPLDGGRIVRAVVWARTGDRARGAAASSRSGRVLGYGLIGVGLWEVLFLSPSGLWVALVGWFVLGSARAEAGQAVTARLAGLRAADVMSPAGTPVPDWWTVDRITPDGTGVVVLTDFGGQPAGALSRREIESVPEGQRAEVRLRDLVRARRVGAPIVMADASVDMLLAALRLGAGVAVVVDGAGRPVGTVTPDDIARAARERDRV